MAKNRSNAASEIPVWEWIFAAIGFAVVAATIAFLTYQALAGDRSPPDIAVRVESVVPVAHGFLVTIAAANRGDRTAAEVKVQGELKTPSATVETSEMTLQFIPGRSERHGGLYFTRDPRTLALSITARGYANP